MWKRYREFSDLQSDPNSSPPSKKKERKIEKEKRKRKREKKKQAHRIHPRIIPRYSTPSGGTFDYKYIGEHVDRAPVVWSAALNGNTIIGEIKRGETVTGLEIGWLKYATRPRVMEEARRGGGWEDGGGGEREREEGKGGEGGGRMQKSECTPRDTRRWNGSTRYLITYFAKLRQRRRRRSNRPPPTHLFNHHPPISFPSLFIPMNLSTRRFGILTAS